MSGNATPIFSRVGDVQGGPVLTTGAADYTGQSINNAPVFTADATNGGLIQRLRFKPLGTNVASVARIYINNGQGRYACTVSAVAGTPTGTPSTTGGTLQAGTYYAKVYAVDGYGAIAAASTETAAVTVTGTTGSIAWAWSAVTGAVSYFILVGPVTGGEGIVFTSATNSYTQTAMVTTRDTSIGFTNNNWFYGELSLPATTATSSASLPDFDYPMNFALPPGYRVLVGLGTTVAAGWAITAIGGKY